MLRKTIAAPDPSSKVFHSTILIHLRIHCKSTQIMNLCAFYTKSKISSLEPCSANYTQQFSNVLQRSSKIFLQYMYYEIDFNFLSNVFKVTFTPYWKFYVYSEVRATCVAQEKFFSDHSGHFYSHSSQ